MKARGYSAARRRHIYAYLSILPAILIIFIFTTYPVFYNLDLALHKNVLTAPGKHPFTGMKNFVDVLKTPGLIRSFKTTVQFTAISVVMVVILVRWSQGATGSHPHPLGYPGSHGRDHLALDVCRKRRGDQRAPLLLRHHRQVLLLLRQPNHGPNGFDRGSPMEGCALGDHIASGHPPGHTSRTL